MSEEQQLLNLKSFTRRFSILAKIVNSIQWNQYWHDFQTSENMKYKLNLRDLKEGHSKQVLYSYLI